MGCGGSFKGGSPTHRFVPGGTETEGADGLGHGVARGPPQQGLVFDARLVHHLGAHHQHRGQVGDVGGCQPQRFDLGQLAVSRLRGNHSP